MISENKKRNDIPTKTSFHTFEVIFIGKFDK